MDIYGLWRSILLYMIFNMTMRPHNTIQINGNWLNGISVVIPEAQIRRRVVVNSSYVGRFTRSVYAIVRDDMFRND